MEPLDANSRKPINEALQLWRQGDCVLDAQWLTFRIALDAPLTDEAAVAAADGIDNAEVSVYGFAVITQTCDIIRDCGDRPFVEVCPLVSVEEDKLQEIKRGYRPNYAYIPSVSNNGLVADLDRVMTVEKAVLAKWERIVGCLDDRDSRNLSAALARNRARTAFPNDFVFLVADLKTRMTKKHDKDTEEGKAMRALREIRVRAAPSWDATQIQIMFWFVRSEHQPTFEQQTWDVLLKAWLNRVTPIGRFTEVHGAVVTLDDLTARDYVESDPLDLDQLSGLRG